MIQQMLKNRRPSRQGIASAPRRTLKRFRPFVYAEKQHRILLFIAVGIRNSLSNRSLIYLIDIFSAVIDRSLETWISSRPRKFITSSSIREPNRMLDRGVPRMNESKPNYRILLSVSSECKRCLFWNTIYLAFKPHFTYSYVRTYRVLTRHTFMQRPNHPSTLFSRSSFFQDLSSTFP